MGEIQHRNIQPASKVSLADRISSSLARPSPIHLSSSHHTLASMHRKKHREGRRRLARLPHVRLDKYGHSDELGNTGIIKSAATVSLDDTSKSTDFDLQRALVYHECPICFDPLYCRPIVALHRTFAGIRSRSCSHLYHSQCVQDSETSMCVLCHREYDCVVAMPDPVSAPSMWFSFVDAASLDTLPLNSIVDALSCALPIDISYLAVHTHWNPSAHVACLTRAEFLHRHSSLLLFLLAHPPEDEVLPPFTEEGAADWFAYWDDDDAHVLGRHELRRALTKTLRSQRADAEALERAMQLLPVEEDGALSAPQLCSIAGSIVLALQLPSSADPTSPCCLCAASAPGSYKCAASHAQCWPCLSTRLSLSSSCPKCAEPIDAAQLAAHAPPSLLAAWALLRVTDSLEQAL